jgi:hypothetical protein
MYSEKLERMGVDLEVKHYYEVPLENIKTLRGLRNVLREIEFMIEYNDEKLIRVDGDLCIVSKSENEADL